MKKLLYTLLVVFSFNTLLAQERPEIDLQDFIETIFQTPDEDVAYDDLYESLYQLYTNPINLNNTDRAELGGLYQLNVEQINNLEKYIQDNYPLLSIYELQTIEGFDAETLEKIKPFVEVRSPGDASTQGSLVQRILKEDNNYLLLRTERIIEQQEGFAREDSTGYQGSQEKVYGRFRTSHTKDFSFGFTFEKDAGESISWDPSNEQYGFDYYSAHLFLEEKWKFKKIAIGDYQMQFGQGLILGAGFNPGKGGETITTVKRGNNGLRPYTSVLESGFMRGTAVTYAPTNYLEITPFYSKIKQDGSIRIDSVSDAINEFISGISDIGFHRTFNELGIKNEIDEQSYGLNVTYNGASKNLQAGVTAMQTDYSVPIAKTPNNYNQFEFQGDQNHNIGVFANYNWQNFLFFSEGAVSKSGGRAYIAGFLSSLSPIVSLSFSIRDYAKDYHSFYGNSFGEGSRIINEQGMYWGIKIAPSRYFKFSAYYDRFVFPWLKFRTDAPSEGYEYLFRTDYRPTKKIKMFVQMRQQSKEISISETGDNLSTLAEGIKRTYVGNLDLSINANIGLKSRVQYSNYDLDNERTQGIAVVQDINFKINRVKLSTRYAIFDTEDFENRQYIYEKDVLYAFSIPAYNGVGSRAYLLAQYKPNRKITLWARYGIYIFDDTETIGSGLNQIQGDQRSDIKFQIRYKF